MSTRLLKEKICTSESINQLSWIEEAFFYRLIVNCDDYGRMDGRIPILKARLFPLKSVTEQQVESVVNKLVTVGIACRYIVEDKPYLQLATWEQYQNVRAKKSKYPAPEEGTFTHLQVSESSCIQLNTSANKSPRNPNPNPNPHPLPSPDGLEVAEAVPYQKIQDAYNDICTRLPAVTKLSDKRKKTVNARLREHGFDNIVRVFELANESDFLCGCGDRGFKATFDWLMKPDNFLKTLEGNYTNQPQNYPPTAQGVAKTEVKGFVAHAQALFSQETVLYPESWEESGKSPEAAVWEGEVIPWEE